MLSPPPSQARTKRGYCRPPTFKQSTPSCRTNMRQLLWREQCLERDRRTDQDTSTTSTSTAACKIPRALEDQPRIQDIPTEVYKVSVSLHLILQRM